jgi:drug/metabolite transporter (DMT)-like permease
MAFSSTTGLPPINNKRGALWMVAASTCFAIVTVLVKTLGTELHPFVIVFFRSVFGATVILPFLVRHGLTIFRTHRPGLHLIRVACSTVSIIAAFYAITHMPLAAAVSLSFTRPLFMILLAVLLLGEVVRWRRGLATLIGFGGVLIMLGPTGMIFQSAAFSALLSAAAISGALAIIRQQAAEDGTITLMAWYAFGLVVTTVVPALPVWQTPHGMQWIYLLAVGVFSSAGQYFLIRAFAIGEATVMNPIDYMQIILAALFGFLFFSEIPSVWTGVGALVIVASTLYILFREARVKDIPPPPMRAE